MDSPKFAKIGDELYKINTSYKVALKCNEIACDDNIRDYETMLAIIYLLFGDKGLHDKENHEQLLDIAFKYLACGEETEISNEKPDMDFKQDFGLIKASFMSDYGIDLSKQELDWYDFYTYLNGLKEDCVLNRVRNLRTFDERKIEDRKERQQIINAKKRFALKKEVKLTEKQQKSVDEFYKSIGF